MLHQCCPPQWQLLPQEQGWELTVIQDPLGQGACCWLCSTALELIYKQCCAPRMEINDFQGLVFAVSIEACVVHRGRKLRATWSLCLSKLELIVPNSHG